jgi:secondary thiamine-phosphate synthase enzyme
MRTFSDGLRITTSEALQIIDITGEVRALVERSGVSDGLVTLISNHTTAYITLNESEEKLQRDMTEFLGRVAPAGGGYGHDVAPVDGRANAHAHLIGLFMSASASIPVTGGRLLLGAWQSILFVELDGPREGRLLTIHVIGNAPS